MRLNKDLNTQFKYAQVNLDYPQLVLCFRSFRFSIHLFDLSCYSLILSHSSIFYTITLILHIPSIFPCYWFDPFDDLQLYCPHSVDQSEHFLITLLMLNTLLRSFLLCLQSFCIMLLIILNHALFFWSISIKSSIYFLSFDRFAIICITPSIHSYYFNPIPLSPQWVPILSIPISNPLDPLSSCHSLPLFLRSSTPLSRSFSHAYNSFITPKPSTVSQQSLHNDKRFQTAITQAYQVIRQYTAIKSYIVAWGKENQNWPNPR